MDDHLPSSVPTPKNPFPVFGFFCSGHFLLWSSFCVWVSSDVFKSLHAVACVATCHGDNARCHLQNLFAHLTIADEEFPRALFPGTGPGMDVGPGDTGAVSGSFCFQGYRETVSSGGLSLGQMGVGGARGKGEGPAVQPPVFPLHSLQASPGLYP